MRDNAQCTCFCVHTHHSDSDLVLSKLVGVHLHHCAEKNSNYLCFMSVYVCVCVCCVSLHMCIVRKYVTIAIGAPVLSGKQ